MTGIRRALLIGLLLASVAACSVDPYPLRTPAGASQWSPTLIGEPVRSVVLYLQPRPGDRVELVAAEAVGQLNDAEGRFDFSPPMVAPRRDDHDW